MTTNTRTERAVLAGDGTGPEVAAEGLVQGVQEHRTVIDEAIKARSKNWTLVRMPRVDLNVMRMATYELMFRGDIPKKVSINEAIEIARKFGDKESPAFVTLG